MATKRPDQLPSGSHFGFDDIVIVEKNPNKSSRSLEKTSISEFMGSALQFDPSRIGQNAITGSQSELQWLISSVNTIASSNTNEAIPYSSYIQQNPGKEQPYITQTPSISITPTVTPTTTPVTSALPTPTITPTPTRTPQGQYNTITLEGPLPMIYSLPERFRPSKFGYTSWALVDHPTTIENINQDFEGQRPISFTPSSMEEEFFSMRQIVQGSNVMIIQTWIEELGEIHPMGPSSSVTFRIAYSNG